MARIVFTVLIRQEVNALAAFAAKKIGFQSRQFREDVRVQEAVANAPDCFAAEVDDEREVPMGGLRWGLKDGADDGDPLW